MTASQLAATRVMGGVIVTPAMPGDVRAILDLITAVHLPPEGIAAAMEYFWVARASERIVGAVGLEVYDDMALLRSLAVALARQRTGLGRALTEMALSYLTTPPVPCRVPVDDHSRGVFCPLWLLLCGARRSAGQRATVGRVPGGLTHHRRLYGAHVHVSLAHARGGATGQGSTLCRPASDSGHPQSGNHRPRCHSGHRTADHGRCAALVQAARSTPPSAGGRS